MSTWLSLFAVLFVVISAASLLVFQAYTGVPSLPSSASEAADVIALLRRAGLKDRAKIYDLGSGWGTLVVALARAFPAAEVHGIEVSPLPYLVARVRTWKLANVSLIYKDFTKAAPGDADAVTCYLMTDTMRGVARLPDATLAAGTLVVSITFWFRGRTVCATRQAPMRGAVALYQWPALAAVSPEITSSVASIFSTS
ncbi:trans-aconitate methyltransferase [Paraburkholderia sp. GAS333]|uniref:SAM-dependent methyltransferase n=1 Tax=Paraburkholderia sp. GAS333 TaxID=3156279 RepID=UPI003D1AE80D